MARPRWWWGWCAVFGPGTIHKVKPMGLDARVHGWEEEGGQRRIQRPFTEQREAVGEAAWERAPSVFWGPSRSRVD